MIYLLTRLTLVGFILVSSSSPESSDPLVIALLITGVAANKKTIQVGYISIAIYKNSQAQ